MPTYSARTLITASYRKITVKPLGETLGGEILVVGLENLNTLLFNLAAMGITIFSSVKENFSLVTGTTDYTIGDGGTFDTIRPNEVLGGYIRDADFDYPVTTIFEKDYRRIRHKQSQGRPRNVYFQPEYPLGILSFYFNPDQAYDYHIWSLKHFAEITESNIAAALVFPPEYRRYLVYNLAVDSAPEWGKPVPASVERTALKTERNVVSLNAARRAGPVAIFEEDTLDSWAAFNDE